MRRHIITLAAITLGPWFLWQGASDYLEGKHSQSWPTVQGIVKQVDVTERSGRRGSVTYVPFVQYGYDVDGKPYGSSRISIKGAGTSSMQEALQTVMRYPKDGPVTVHYNPANPDLALLEPGADGEVWLGMGFGLLALLFGLYNVRMLWEEFQSTPVAPSSGL